MQRFSVIDLGSNTIRLVVYDVRSDKRSIKRYRVSDRSKLFKAAVNEKKTVGLSTYVQDGVFSRNGIEKAVSVLQELLSISRNVDSDKTSIFATAVLRNCRNSDEAIEEIERQIGEEIDLLSDSEEAHLGYVGATCTDPAQKGTLIDIGGGSTELSVLTKDGDTHDVSIGMGSVSSYAKHVELVLPTKKEVEAISVDFRKRIEALIDMSAYRSDILYGIGGSVRAVAKMDALMFDRAKKRKDVSLDHINEIFGLLEDDPSKFAHLAVRAVPDRLHSLMPGATILLTCMTSLGAKKVSVRKYGVREGYLLDRMLDIF